MARPFAYPIIPITLVTITYEQSHKKTYILAFSTSTDPDPFDHLRTLLRFYTVGVHPSVGACLRRPGLVKVFFCTINASHARHAGRRHLVYTTEQFQNKLLVTSMNPDQTAQMHMLIWVGAVCICQVVPFLEVKD